MIAILGSFLIALLIGSVIGMLGVIFGAKR